MKERGAKRESGGRGWGGAVCDDGSTRLTPFPLRPITTGFELFLRGLHSEMIFSIYYYYISLLIMFYFEDQEVFSVLNYCQMPSSLNEVYQGNVLPSVTNQSIKIILFSLAGNQMRPASQKYLLILLAITKSFSDCKYCIQSFTNLNLISLSVCFN